MKYLSVVLFAFLFNIGIASAAETCGQVVKLKYTDAYHAWEITFADGSVINASYKTIGDQAFISAAIVNKLKICFVDVKDNSGKLYKRFSSVEQ